MPQTHVIVPVRDKAVTSDGERHDLPESGYPLLDGGVVLDHTPGNQDVHADVGC